MASASHVTNSKRPWSDSSPLYRDGDVIRDAIDAAAEQRQSDGAALEDQRRALAEEIRRAERALDRYYTAFETGDLDAKRFQTRTAALETRLADLHEQDLALAAQLAPQAPTTPDAANLAAVADQLESLVISEPEADKSTAPPAHQRPPRQRPKRDPADLPRRHGHGLRTAKFSGRTWDRTRDLSRVKRALSR